MFILTETEQDYNHACAYLKQHLPKLIVKGHYCFEENLQDEQIVNTVNTIAPDIILSILPSPLQEEWIVENSSKVNAKLYVGMGNVVETIRMENKKIPSIVQALHAEGIYNKFKSRNKSLSSRILKRKVAQYNTKKGEDVNGTLL